MTCIFYAKRWLGAIGVRIFLFQVIFYQELLTRPLFKAVTAIAQSSKITIFIQDFHIVI